MASVARIPADQAQRIAALDPARSFIVQAPAGSGKTGLLTQRFLGLLATVDNPEEVVAITFTRKAAAQMRARVLQALAQAGAAEPPDDYERQTWRLAQAALQHAETRGWHLLDNPQRLRIRTIDSLCQSIARQMPLRSGFGDTPGVQEDGAELYREAARSVLGELEADEEFAAALTLLLERLDNNFEALQSLIADMLERRDQWLPPLMRPNPRWEIEQVLANVVESHLRRLLARFPAGAVGELAALARYAARQLGPDHAMAVCSDLESLPPATADGLPAWNALAGLLLTQNGGWRRTIDVRNGFPAGPGAAAKSKGAMRELLEALGTDVSLAEELHALRALPEPAYADADWAVLQALFTVLAAAAAHLKLVFRDHAKVDFCETALAALAALGNDLQPTDLALRLDYSLRHMLVDEFQDTSQNQHDLLRRLTVGWQPGDGRTLFLVGDPMQSIYRFRKAEVGLFLDAWQGRLGNVDLEPLRLSVNFRSQQGLIDWVNQRFPLVFPAAGDKVTGAVPYAASVAHQPAAAGPAVSVHAFIGRNDQAEAKLTMQIIDAAAATEPGGTTAVLVRSKAHLDPLIRMLRAQGRRFQAMEIGSLADRPAVMDALALTLAMLHPADRVSWLALLHGPLCGLTLADLHVLTGADLEDDWATIPRLLDEPRRRERLSGDGRQRVEAFMRVIGPALEDFGRRPLHDWVEGTWLMLGGPASLPGPAGCDGGAADDVESFFRLLRDLDDSGQAATPERIRDATAALFSMPDPQADPGLQLMTIHKAKGLEFDTVILPGLGRAPRSDAPRLLYWLETTAESGEPEVFFGPLKSERSNVESPTSAYIRKLDKDIDRLESARLLYVATTRARRRLHLIGHATATQEGELSVKSGSLLARAWPAVREHWSLALEQEARISGRSDGGVGEQEEPEPATVAGRLPAGWVCPPPPATSGLAGEAAGSKDEAVIYEWVGGAARAVGTVVHQLLQRLARTPIARLEEIPRFEATVRRMLQQQGLTVTELGPPAQRVRAALERTLQDERGRWIVSSRHADARCEFPLTAMIEGQLRHFIIDRSFIDEDGVRWVIDYKTGTHEGGDVAAFLDREQERYQAQLRRYAEAFRQFEGGTVRTALYYPLIVGGWREVEG